MVQNLSTRITRFNVPCKGHYLSFYPGFDPSVGKIWRREWQPTPVFLPTELHGQRSLVGYTVHGVAKSGTQLSNFERYKTGTHLHSLLHWLHLMWPHIIFRLELQVSICPLMLTGRDPSEISQTCHLRITRFNVSCKGHYLFFYP